MMIQGDLDLSGPVRVTFKTGENRNDATVFEFRKETGALMETGVEVEKSLFTYIDETANVCLSLNVTSMTYAVSQITIGIFFPVVDTLMGPIL